MKSEQSKLSEDLLFDHVNDFMNSQEDPFVSNAVLKLIGHQRLGSYLTCMPDYLRIEAELLESIVATMVDKGLVHIPEKDYVTKSDLRQAYLTDDGEKFVWQKIRNDFNYPQWENLTKDEISVILEAAEPFVKFSYSKRIGVPLEDLDPLKKKIYKSIDKLKKSEQKFMIELLDLPEGSRADVSFVHTADPAWHDGGGYQDPFYIHTGQVYDSYRAALDAGITEVRGVLILNPPFKDEKKTIDAFPVTIESYWRKEGLKLGMSSTLGLGANVWEKPIEYQKQGIVRAAELVEAISDMYHDKRTT